MAARALAIANNDIIHIAWSVDETIPGCTGFSIFRKRSDGQDTEVPLHSLLTFVAEPAGAAPKPGTTSGTTQPLAPHQPPDPEAPPALIKAYKWRDLLRPDQHGIAFKYRIVAMQGPERNPVPLPGGPEIATNDVTSTSRYGAIDAFFNRGILSTQALANALIPFGGANVTALKKAIADKGGQVRARLAGQLENAVLSLLKQRAAEGGDCFAALYELTDDRLISELVAAGDKLHIVLSNNTGDDRKNYDGANHDGRERLAQSGAELISRYLPDGRSIGHNKFMVYVDKDGQPQTVLTGSTNWTASGLCTQNNNCLIVRSPQLAERYLQYWGNLKDDTVAGGIPPTAKAVTALQGKTLRTQDAVKPKVFPLDAETIEVWPSPNTGGFIPSAKQSPDRPPTPPDMNDLFEAVANAQQAVLLLVFQPGAAGSARSWTIVKQLSDVCHAKPQLFVRGAISDEQEALEFEAARNNLMDAEIVAPAGIMKDTAAWMREIYKAGHAIVHDKIVVIDPFSDKCVVATGSHNLGFKASYNNDENLVIVRGNRPLAEAYAAHIADIFEHYRWRWYNKREAERKAAAAWVKDGSDPDAALDKKFNPNNFFQADIPHDDVGDTWQARYFDPTRLASLERQFWVGGSGALAPRTAGTGPGFTSGLTPDETAFRAAKAALNKKKKQGAASDDESDDGAPARKRKPAAKKSKPAKKRAPARKAKTAAKKQAKKKAKKSARKPAKKRAKKATAKSRAKRPKKRR
jgi:phosphatidylserine/phosphatidylglycerophosphate/cardiolipin synthase-like enzyme